MSRCPGLTPKKLEKCPNVLIRPPIAMLNTSTHFQTRTVMVGNIGIGGGNPIRIQSMTTSPTRDVEVTVEQVIRLADAGCEIVRVTVQGKKEAAACEEIKNSLIQKGYTTPLVADIHFYPPAAMEVLEWVDKVRINPGNYLDKRATFREIIYTDETYAAELLRIEENFTPLVTKCKALGKALRIGTNHGSLSDRIMNRYGDTPEGMVESALEYARICRKHDFHDFIFSMKASNTHVMICAYRLLVAEMVKLGWDYPLHLGVTEAGEGEDGRVKSAIGMGSLLLDGIGDTIRVSLTEDPWYEIDPCQRLVALAESYQKQAVEPFSVRTAPFEKRLTHSKGNLPLHRDGTVALKTPTTTADPAPDLILDQPIPTLKQARFDLTTAPIVRVTTDDEADWDLLKKTEPQLILLNPPSEGRLYRARHFFEWLQENSITTPVLLNFAYSGEWDDTIIGASAECGSLLCDGLGDGLLLEGPYPADALSQLSFNILQGARMRTFKTEFISCPSCGRTLFNLQEVSERIRQRTGHLPGVKIAVMGCIVNGPGEMADADFGYVGSRAGKIDLYVGKTRVEKNIDNTDADDRLIALIKEHDRWIDPPC